MEHCTQILNDEVILQLFPNSKGKVPFKSLYELLKAVLDKVKAETQDILEEDKIAGLK